MRKLEAGRIDCTFEDSNVYQFITRENGLTNKFKATLCPKMAAPIYILFSPAHPKAAEYTKMMDEGIGELRGNGRLKAILAKYGLADWR